MTNHAADIYAALGRHDIAAALRRTPPLTVDPTAEALVEAEAELEDADRMLTEAEAELKHAEEMIVALQDLLCARCMKLWRKQQ